MSEPWRAPVLVLHPQLAEMAHELGLTENRDYVVSPYLPELVDAVHIDHNRINRTINDKGIGRYPFSRW